jgi:hypothetical protein
MKKLLLISFAVCFTLIFLHTTVEAQNSKNSITSSSISVLNGGWQQAGIRINGKLASNGYRPQHRVYNDGCYSGVGQDSTGAWKVTIGGTYEISNNVWKEKILYSSNPNYIGGTHWQDFTLNGDTLTLKYFNKVFNSKGEDITATYKDKIETIWVRAKK